MDTQVIEKCRAVYLTAEDLRIAASILYNAYYDDPFFIEALGKDNEVSYQEKLRAAIREELHTLWKQEQALIGFFDGERMLGVACVMTQDVPLGEDRVWDWKLKMVLSAGWGSTQAIMKKDSHILQHLPNRHCGILQFIAVSPNEQNKGFGRTLVNAVLSWCDEQPDVDGIGVFVTKDAHYELFINTGFEQLSSININNVEGDLLFHRP
ncbi:N-acetyltransferase [Parashewanella curva]|uniref:N-acetyltransferase n=1 Tax=Parashewanella curva TaxID=2338552 RepID=A0A3L8PRM6_9GAMM|nr:GNAT family N-acetyltransferase [Parashewanella curva]RLV57874.1 N-acetyltransferase [Parashewanella curva]